MTGMPLTRKKGGFSQYTIIMVCQMPLVCYCESPYFALPLQP